MTDAPAIPVGELCIMDHTGDTKLIWNPNNEDETSAARTMFNSLKKKGHIAYRVSSGGDKGEVMTEFDPRAEKIIMTPPVVGG